MVTDDEYERMLRDFVCCESPSSDRHGLEAMAAVIEAEAASLGIAVTRCSEEGAPPELLLGPPEASVLLLGHLDTVHPLGSLERQPWRRDGDRCSGPGVLDMKAGLVIGLQVLAATAGVAMLITADEEVGSPTGRHSVERLARGRTAVLVLEPAAGGDLKVARKGVARLQVSCAGRDAHAGLEPERGANALVALARVIAFVEGLADQERSTTATPTLARAGTTSNTVPDTATLTVDLRAWTTAEIERLVSAVASFDPGVDGVTLSVSTSGTRPAFEASASASLAALALELAPSCGIEQLSTRAVGGGSDGNFTAAMGIATLDGLGGVGANPHGAEEWVSLSSLPRRAALISQLIAALDQAVR